MKKATRVDEVLAELYGKKNFKKKTDPLTELVTTVLSQNTSDTNRDRAFAGLREKFPDWGDVLCVSRNQLASAIKVGGLANIKAARILKMLKSIKEMHSELSLDFLSDWPDDEVREYLLKIDGVGPKTAACVLAFALGRDVMPVDTHVHRVSSRLGLIPQEMNAETAHDFFLVFRGTVDLYQFHLNMINHGRKVCKARKPLCGSCKLRRLCRFYDQEIKQREQAA